MRSFLALVLVATWSSISGQAVCAEEVAAGVPQRKAVGQIVTVDLIRAHREYQLAKLRMHEYRYVALPRQRRDLDDQINSTKAEIAVLRRRLRDYRPFLQVGQYSPARTAAENHQLGLIAAEQRLRQLQDDRLGLFRLTRQNNQIYRLDVLEAATRLALARRDVE